MGIAIRGARTAGSERKRQSRSWSISPGRVLDYMSTRWPRTQWATGCRSIYSGPTVHESRRTLVGMDPIPVSIPSAAPALSHCGTGAALEHAPAGISITISRWLANESLGLSGAQCSSEGVFSGQQKSQVSVRHYPELLGSYHSDNTCVLGDGWPKRDAQKTARGRSRTWKSAWIGSGHRHASTAGHRIAPGVVPRCLQPGTGKWQVKARYHGVKKSRSLPDTKQVSGFETTAPAIFLA